MNLKEVYTLKEASELWNVSDSNLRNALGKFNRFEKQIADESVKKSAGTWIVTKKAMEEVFGKSTKLEEIEMKEKFKSLPMDHLLSFDEYLGLSELALDMYICSKADGSASMLINVKESINDYFIGVWDSVYDEIRTNEEGELEDLKVDQLVITKANLLDDLRLFVEQNVDWEDDLYTQLMDEIKDLEK